MPRVISVHLGVAQQRRVVEEGGFAAVEQGKVVAIGRSSEELVEDRHEVQLEGVPRRGDRLVGAIAPCPPRRIR
eukprot:4684350-Pleurochrysis_carterae.AAC.1